MPNYVNKTTKEVLLSLDQSLVPGLLTDWYADPQGLATLIAAGVPYQPPCSHINYVDIGGGVIEAQEMTQPEKDVVDLPLLKAAKIVELEARVLSVVQLRMSQGATESDILDAINAAATPAEVQAIDVNGVTPHLYGKMVGDAIYTVATASGGAVAAGSGWVKAPCTTAVLGNSIGKSFITNGDDNRIVCRFDGRVRLRCGMSVLIGAASGQLECALNLDNNQAPSGNPGTALQQAGFIVSGVVGANLFGSFEGPLNVSENDVLEVWVRQQGTTSTGTISKMQFSAERIPG